MNLLQVSVAGSVEANAGSLSIGAGTVIGGDLQVHDLSVALEENRICGATIRGNVEVHNNAIPIKVGADLPDAPGLIPSDFCEGNTVGGNLHIHNNSSTTSVDRNSVAGNLEVHNNTGQTEATNNAVAGRMFCHSNQSIAGGPNVATANAVGQCSQAMP